MAALVVGRGGDTVELIVDAVEGFVDAVERRELPPLIAPYLRGQFRALVVQPEGELLEVDPERLLAMARGGGGAAAVEARKA